jgi:hypothetical protein
MAKAGEVGGFPANDKGSTKTPEKFQRAGTKY